MGFVNFINISIFTVNMGKNEIIPQQTQVMPLGNSALMKERDENIQDVKNIESSDSKLQEKKTANPDGDNTQRDSEERTSAKNQEKQRLIEEASLTKETEGQKFEKETSEEQAEDAPSAELPSEGERADLNSEPSEITKNKSDEELCKLLTENSQNTEEDEETNEIDPENEDLTPEEEDESSEEENSDEDVEDANQEITDTLELVEQEESLEQSPSSTPKKKENMLEISTSTLSYERFLPGRILGNTFIVRNNSSVPTKLKVTFENSNLTKQNVGKRLDEYYDCDPADHPDVFYNKHLENNLEVTKEALKVWHLEDPYTKKLAQFVDFELGPYSEEEFIIVLKSPIDNKE